MSYFASPDPDPTESALLDLLPPNAAMAGVAFGLPPDPNGQLRDVDQGAVGPTGCDGREAGLAAMVELRLDRQGAEHIEAFERRALADASVRQVWRVSPGPDFVLIVQCADMAAYHALTKRLFRQKWNVRNVKTRFALRRSKAGHRHRGGKVRGRHADAAAYPEEPALLQPSAWASPAYCLVGPERDRRSAPAAWGTRVAAASQAVVVGLLDGAALEFRIPHFFAEEVRSLAA